MKIMRLFPLIALAFLGIIFYALYKTGAFVNKKVNSETLLTQDSLVRHANNALQPTSDTIASIVPVPTTVVSSKNTEGGQKQSGASQSDATKKEPVKTTLAATTPTTKKEVKPASKTDIKKQKAAHKDSVTMKPDAETFKAASALEKKAGSELRFHVVIGTYAKEANAKLRASQFEQKHFKKATVVKQGGFYRVCADEFEFLQAANQYAQKLKADGEDNMVLKF